MISTARISVKVDADVKQGAQRVFSEIGMDMTTAINLFLKTVTREECIPFSIRTERAYREHEAFRRGYILAELEEAEKEAADPNTKWLSHDEMMANAAKRREARKRV
jgi:DNA-damage-inducible protein J